MKGQAFPIVARQKKQEKQVLLFANVNIKGKRYMPRIMSSAHQTNDGKILEVKHLTNSDNRSEKTVWSKVARLGGSRSLNLI